MSKFTKKLHDNSIDENISDESLKLIIEDTGYKNEGFTGRPAKLYRFKEDIKDINLYL